MGRVLKTNKQQTSIFTSLLGEVGLKASGGGPALTLGALAGGRSETSQISCVYSIGRIVETFREIALTMQYIIIIVRIFKQTFVSFVGVFFE